MSSLTLAHLGPQGTYSQLAARAYSAVFLRSRGLAAKYRDCPSIAQTLLSAALGEADLAIVPVENSTEGGIAVTLDTLWEQGNLQIQQELVLPILHALYSEAPRLSDITQVYSHPQALGQCQKWLSQNLPQATAVAVNSTTEALGLIRGNSGAAAIASPQAGLWSPVPLLARNINDYPDNCTRFWVVGAEPSLRGARTALAFSALRNVPGALVKPLQVLAEREINLSRIESRPTKRSLGEYLFFMDLEISQDNPLFQEALAALKPYTDALKLFGSYDVLSLQNQDLSQWAAPEKG
ncbi:MAG: prephenate dehydratase [Cyanobacteria bacterium RI_101]|nr:prephenate dehydratase [Cyanobacteria bacterium RI_101]